MAESEKVVVPNDEEVAPTVGSPVKQRYKGRFDPIDTF